MIKPKKHSVDRSDDALSVALFSMYDHLLVHSSWTGLIAYSLNDCVNQYLMGVWADVNPVNVTVLAPVVDARQINIVQVGLFQVFFK